MSNFVINKTNCEQCVSEPVCRRKEYRKNVINELNNVLSSFTEPDSVHIVCPHYYKRFSDKRLVGYASKEEV